MDLTELLTLDRTGIWDLFTDTNIAFIFIAIIIGLFIVKGIAIWSAAKRSEKGWFWAMLIINPLALVSIFYLLTKGRVK